MRPLRKILKSSPLKKKKGVPTQEQEIEDLLLGMFRDLPQQERQIVFDIMTEFYSLKKRNPS